MNDAHIAAIITAGAGISGVILGNLFVAIKESLSDKRKDERDRTYLAVLVVSHLERFVNGCWQVARDDGTSEGRPAGGGGEYHQPTVTAPEFLPLDIDVEWKVLPKDLMYDILQIPDKREGIQNRLSGLWEYDDPPEYSDYFLTRQREYAQLGLDVSDIARRLRVHADMPREAFSHGGWQREFALENVIEQVDAQRREIAKRSAEMLSAAGAVSQQ
ncbi:hypothetical protein DJFAAGMI_01896 [Comamonas sp. PE63]|uniref:Uncharacterized protein n=1 Tax=Comamonas brasiliensis TaxID=1812482 RepID=A0ABS5LS58_9BURK|nr:hypothetical protein [Comamonas sp. PE63]MBS3019157.1 hypothetical protein [Comamonas sp. PE63]